jgi:ABC-type Mn2+/Zn2+ transport system permease subunit
MTPSLPQATSTILLSGVTAVAAGLMGCYALMRRMTLAGDALSHVALPGIGLALLLHLHPLAGAVAALLGGGFFIWLLEQRTRIATETVIGVVFSAALAVGALLTTGEDLIDALFGTPGGLGSWELVAGIAGSGLVIAFAIVARDRLIVTLVSSEIAYTSGINVQRLNLLYLLSFALTVALGLRYLGVLLMGSLVIIPAATARRLAHNLTGMFAASTAVAVAATVGGTWMASRLQLQTGPVIVAIASGCFLLATLIKPRT